MLFRKFPVRSFGWFVVLSVCASLPCEAAENQLSESKHHTNAKRSRAADDIFAKDGFLRIKIEVPKEGVNKLRRHSWGWGESQKDRPIVQATIYEGGKAYTNVALHLKGAAGSFRPVDDRPAFT